MSHQFYDNKKMILNINNAGHGIRETNARNYIFILTILLNVDAC
jgi:hypothetical protein